MAGMAGHITRAAEAVARSLLVDTCAVTRPATPGVMDAVTLQYDDVPVEVWTGPCFVNDRPGSPRSPEWVNLEALGRTDTAVRVRLPLTCPQLQAGDVITVTASASTVLVGATLDVVSDTVGSYAVTKIVHARWRQRTT